MATHSAEVSWYRGHAAFTDNRYSRAHHWRFDGGAVVEASTSPDVVRVPFSNPAGVDPEEALVAAVSSCHMLWFLSIAAKAQYLVDAYVDNAVGEMDRNAAGQLFVARITLRPLIAFSGSKIPTNADVDALHHAAHEECYIAHSVRSDITVAGTWTHVAAERHVLD